MTQEKKSKGGADRVDIYTKITDRIITALEEGVRPWVQPWSAGHLAGRISRPLRHNGQAYSGINVLLLWSESVARGFRSPTWMTFRQAAEIGAHVRKGETGSTVVYANRIKKTETTSGGEEIEKDIPFLKGLYRLQPGADRRYARGLQSHWSTATKIRYCANCWS